ncbi:tribbles homolog 2-like [Limulus polyphemus]|uniref:Tribbles homolog 2-like n=1 Tax=Limulus polyphemus TaxID=6850 RepID=A0ABM1BXK7_LIMPO|nr:tribbles homolog 2-like [Limulus polyphemus]
MNVLRPPLLNLQHCRLKQEHNIEKRWENGGKCTGSLSPNLQPPTPPILPNTQDPFTASAIGNYILLEQFDGSTLYRCINVKTNEEYICKVVPNDRYQKTVAGYFRLDSHPSVNQIEHVLIGETKSYVIFRRSYGDLHSYVRNKRRLREQEALRLFRQVVLAVQACHEAGVILRDLKLRKFVFKDPERTQLKLETLDDAVVLDEGSSDHLSDKHGCPAYVSPEILTTSGSYSGRAADCWSLGVMLYTLLVGRYPFHDSDHSALFGKICRGKFTIPDTISSRAKCLIRSLLRKDPAERLAVDDVLHHPWFRLMSRGGASCLDLQLHISNGNDSKTLDQTVPDLAVPESNI